MTLPNFLLQSIFCSLVLYSIYYWLLRNESCHRFNRYFLLLSAGFSLIFPLLKFNSAVFSNTLIATISLPELVLSDYNSYKQSSDTHLWLWALYGAGVLFFLIKLLAKLRSVYQMIAAGTKEPQNDYTLIPTNGKLPTFSFMNYLFWDETQQLEERERQQILRHELAHIREKHSLDLLLLEILQCLLWFNPLMSVIKSSLSITHEFQADEKASEGESVEEYQRLLAHQVLNQYGLSLASHFNQSQTLKRLKMLSSKNSNVYWGKFVLPVAVCLAVFGVVSCEPSDVNPASQPEAPVNGLAAIGAEDKSNSDGEVFNLVDEHPEPPGGMEAFYQYVAQSLTYPAQARQMGIEGKVFVVFIIDTDGSITDVKALKGIGAGCDAAAVNVIANSPKWQPGIHEGKPVKVRMILPVTFRLD